MFQRYRGSYTLLGDMLLAKHKTQKFESKNSQEYRHVVSSAHAIVCHVMYFKRTHRDKTQQNRELMTFALTWCMIIFVGCSVTPTFFRQITSFSDSFHYTKKQKKAVRGKI